MNYLRWFCICRFLAAKISTDIKNGFPYNLSVSPMKTIINFRIFSVPHVFTKHLAFISFLFLVWRACVLDSVIGIKNFWGTLCETNGSLFCTIDLFSWWLDIQLFHFGIFRIAQVFFVLAFASRPIFGMGWFLGWMMLQNNVGAICAYIIIAINLKAWNN